MPATTPATVRVGDVGAVIRLTIERDGTAVDVSGASTKQIKVYDPDGTLADTLTASFATSGVDGVIQATSTAACFARAGRWVSVAYVVLGAWTGHSTPATTTAIAVGAS
jgi:hypothetical protein